MEVKHSLEHAFFNGDTSSSHHTCKQRGGPRITQHFDSEWSEWRYFWAFDAWIEHHSNDVS